MEGQQRGAMVPKPGSNDYDVHRARLRKEYEDSGIPDDKANEAANESLQRDRRNRPRVETDRALGPKGNRKER